VLLHLEGDLNFAIAGDLSDRLAEISERGPRVVVLRLKRAQHLDATVIESLREAVLTLERSGTRIVLSGLSHEIGSLLAETELGALLGDEGVLRSGDRLFEGFERSMERARALLGDSAEGEIFRRG